MNTEAHFRKHKEEIETGLSYEDELYKENILDHYKNPHNKGSIKDPTISVRELNPTCGDEITLSIKISGNKIKEVSFTGQGCAISQASASMLTDKIKNMNIEDAMRLTNQDMVKMIGIPISVPRMKCAFLPMKALMRALKDRK